MIGVRYLDIEAEAKRDKSKPPHLQSFANCENGVDNMPSNLAQSKSRLSICRG